MMAMSMQAHVVACEQQVFIVCFHFQIRLFPLRSLSYISHAVSIMHLL